MATIYFSSELLTLMAKRPALKPRIERTVNDFFPEIEEARFGRASRSAYYDFRSGTIRVNSGSSVYVIGHELIHYMQDPRHYHGTIKYPSGERSCDLFLFSRSPALVADVWDGDASYLLCGATARALKAYLSRPEGQRLVHEVCAEAVFLRDAGKRDYIKWAGLEIASRIKSRAASPI